MAIDLHQCRNHATCMDGYQLGRSHPPLPHPPTHPPALCTHGISECQHMTEIHLRYKLGQKKKHLRRGLSQRVTSPASESATLCQRASLRACQRACELSEGASGCTSGEGASGGGASSEGASSEGASSEGLFSSSHSQHSALPLAAFRAW